MKTSEGILAEILLTIASMHHRPAMHIGGTNRAGAADILDSTFWIVHRFWAVILEREGDFRRACDVVHERHKCRCQGLADTYRQLNPDADKEAVFQFILDCWAEIAAELDINISAEASHFDFYTSDLDCKDKLN